ncbi:unnamed protein product [Prorocentrum cordatum]|uniref:J domain-containing protein n=1 Tax=Prorocentrum cordatum TaxID=2364126 RepID=A0ABN9U933_9DINO|nr:unnamed protein product [Polarella glacialis]
MELLGWRPLSQPGPSGSQRVPRRSPGAARESATVHGLPEGSPVAVRVVAALSAGAGPAVQLPGHWAELATARPSSSEDGPETPRNLDPLGAPRQGCAATRCGGYKAARSRPEAPAGAPVAGDAELCDRCGAHFSSHDAAPAPAAEAAAAGSGASGGEAGEWRVVARGVFVRDRPSTGGAQVAALSRGQPLSGQLLPSGWVSLDAGCRGRLGIASEEAFVLTHGDAAEMPNLGALLERVELGLSGAADGGGEIEECRAADGAAGEQDARGSIESVQGHAARAAEVLRGRPLSFLVVSAEGISVRERPVAWSPPRGGLQTGDLVRGFPGSGWLLLSGGDLDGWWASIGGGPRSATTLLEAQWSRVTVRSSFMEAAIVEWPGLDPAEYPEITYAVEWRSEDQGGASQRRVTKRAHAHITGLPRGSIARLRVLACVPGQQDSQAPLRLNGAWADVPTAEHARESLWPEEELDSTDPLGGARAGCLASRCVGYAAPEDKHSYLNDFGSVLCRRCGVAFAKHLRAGAARAARGVAQPSPGAPGRYVVQHFAVLMRSEPSLQADKLGALCRGNVVRGRAVGGWLEICREDSERYSGRAGHTAYALVDGTAIGLGALLTPWREGDPLPGDESGEEPLPPVGHRMQDVYTGGVPFLAARVAAVRRRPEAASRLLATLEKGEVVQGLARGAWVQLDLKQEALAERRLPGDHGWCKSEPKDPSAGPLLRCTLLDVQVASSFAEALSLKWTRVPAKLVRYSVEWMLKEDPHAVVHVAETSCRGCSLRVGGLQAGTAYLVRVIAQVLRPRNEAAGGSALHKPGMYRVVHQRGIRVSAEFARDSKALARLPPGAAVNVLEVAADRAQGRVRGRIESPAGWISIFNVQNNAHGARRALELDPEGPFARIVGGWCEGSTGPEVTQGEESNKTWDPLAKTRGACLDCGHCKGYVISSYTFAQRLEDVMCRRCGCPCTRHRVVGDWHGGTAEDKAWAAHQARIRQARLALARKPVIHCRQWSTDGAAAGDDGVRFIVKHVSGATHLYEMLGVANDVDAAELRKAYRKISLRIHPDKVKSKDTDLLNKAETSFKKVAAAYATLGDAGKRAAYDRELASKLTARPEPQDDQAGARQKDKAPARKPVREVELKIVQAITRDEVTLRMPPGSTVLAAKKALSKLVQRGPEDRIELAFLDGAGMSDDFCLDQSFTLWCVGVDLGPPRPVDVLIRDVWTGAYGSVEVLDTSTMSEVKSRVAAAFDVDEGSIAIGLSSPKAAACGARGFEELPSGARLDGRRALHVRGAKPVVYLTLEQGTELQRELVEAYSSPDFQRRLDEMEAAWPMPESLGKQRFRAQFGALVRAAQRDTLQRWGFEGEFAAHDMITAFKRIGSATSTRSGS